MIYDLIIIGGGPAGVAAAVYASRKRLQTLFLTTEWGGQSIVSEKIYNWIGAVTISGNELSENFKKHVLANAKSSENIDSTLEVKEGSKVNSIIKNKNEFSVKTASPVDELRPRENNEEFLTKTILIASGSGRRKLSVKNADKLEHRGLTYCASCDGPLFENMDVAVVGGGNAGFETAAQLLAYCNSVTILNKNDVFNADQITVEKVLKNPKMKAIKNIDIMEIKGDKFVEGLIYKEKNTGEEKELRVAGIFVEIGQIPNTDFAKNLVSLDEMGHIKIDPWTGKTETTGIWAAGDCTNILYHQNNIAAGDAVRAIEDIYLTINIK